MEIEDIVATIFRLSTHWDLRRAPAVCRLWRDVYYKKKRVLGCEAFKLGDLYGIYLTPYFTFEAFYLATMGGHYEIAKHFANNFDKSTINLGVNRTFLYSLMRRRCSPEIIKLVWNEDHGNFLSTAYFEGHIDFVRTIEKDREKQVLNIITCSRLHNTILAEFFEKEFVVSVIKNNDEMLTLCVCPFDGIRRHSHHISCEIDTLQSGKTPDVRIATYDMMCDDPLVVTKYIYDMCDQDSMDIELDYDGYSESVDFIIEKALEHEQSEKFPISIELSRTTFPEYLIKVFTRLPNYQGLILDDAMLEESMQGLEFMEKMRMKPKIDRRVQSMHSTDANQRSIREKIKALNEFIEKE